MGPDGAAEGGVVLGVRAGEQERRWGRSLRAPGCDEGRDVCLREAGVALLVGAEGVIDCGGARTELG